MPMNLIQPHRIANVFIVGILLTGCSSNSPSEQEAKAALIQTIGACQYIEIQSFTKLNGIPDGEGRYRVDTKYTLNFKPSDLYSQSKQPIDSNVERLDVEAKKVQAIVDAYDKAKELYDSEGHEQRYAEIYPDELIKVSAAEQVISDADKAMRSRDADLLRQMQSTIINACPTLNRSVLVDFIGKVPNSWDIYLSNVSLEYNWTINMMKTDNGWQLAR
ncbi:hypothetical protein [uncultured Deefgea sp.]|uniref:hypothetical protein n=1 Tax=uncultured Deefgea sp. TaxID=1304914 RepID=UPI002591F827|nr:hypothetical protein [uncultured Deefgea sp.]